MAKMQMSLKARALRYLSAREHSRLELARKLSAHAHEGEDIEALLDQLAAAGLLSEARFSDSLVRQRASRYGDSRILLELQSHGIAGDALAEIKRDLAENECARASSVLQKKFDRVPEGATGRAKYMRFLQQRGFSPRAIRVAIKWPDGEDE